MVVVLTISLILVMLLLGCIAGIFMYLVKNPPVIHVEIGDVRADVVGTVDVTQAIPSPLRIQLQQLPPEEASPAIAEPITLDILMYVDKESDDWARAARKRHARTLRIELGGWDKVLTALKSEDGETDDNR